MIERHVGISIVDLGTSGLGWSDYNCNANMRILRFNASLTTDIDDDVGFGDVIDIVDGR